MHNDSRGSGLQIPRGEYDSRFFRGILWAFGISYKTSSPSTQHKNGVSECIIVIVATKARAMITDLQLDESPWAEAVNTAVYYHALCPSHALKGKTPHETLHRVRGEITYLRRFGRVVHKLTPKELRKVYGTHKQKRSREPSPAAAVAAASSAE